ncbi:MAG: WbqC family protein [Calditrichaeota bacterium]|nr:WbqC family protein [Calditrichota bacterium]
MNSQSHALAAIRPHYFLTIGDVQKIAAAKAVLFADHLRYSKQRSITRALFPGAQEVLQLTIPVRHPEASNAPLHTIQIDSHQSWPRRHLRALELHYRYAPYFERYFFYLQKHYRFIPVHLTDFLWTLTCWQMQVLFPGKALFRATSEGIRKPDDLIRFMKEQELTHFLCTPEEAGYYSKNYPTVPCNVLPEIDPRAWTPPNALQSHHAFLAIIFYHGPGPQYRLTFA